MRRIPKTEFVYENKTFFAYFLTISCLLHLIFIFSSSSLSRFIKSEFDFNDYDSTKDNYVIEVNLETGREEEKYKKVEEISNEKEKEVTEEIIPEQKRELFVDTSDKATDEEPQVDTNKIGEKGSIAKDTYFGDDNIDNEPRLTGDSELLAKAPDETVSVEPQKAGFPIEPSYGESSPGKTLKSPAGTTQEDAEGRTTEELQPFVTEKMIDNSSSETNSEMNKINDTIEAPDETLDETVTQEANLDDAKDAIEQFEDVDIIASTFEHEEIVLESKPSENTESKTEVAEEVSERIVKDNKENMKIASIPMDRMEKIVKGSKESVSNEIQNDIIQTEPQMNNIPSGDDIPFFEDNISNAPIKGKKSFNIKKHEYAPYYKHIRERISWYWLLQYGTDASINLETKEYKPVIVEFKALPSGKIVDAIIADSAGNELLSSKIKKSIKNTDLNSFPDYISEKYINVRFNFYFF